MIAFDRVSKRYQSEKEALANISFSAERGELLFITGHSGAGKSTLLKLILALEKPSGGRLLVDGLQIDDNLTRRQLAQHRRSIGAVFQDHQLLMDRSVADNVALPLRVSGFPAADCPRRVRAALAKVGLLGKERLFPAALSGGEQQRVGIARAIVSRPKIILADEPTGNLDPDLSAEIMSIFQQFKDVGVCLLIATHDPALIQAQGHRVLTLARGRLIGGGATQ